MRRIASLVLGLALCLPVACDKDGGGDEKADAKKKDGKKADAKDERESADAKNDAPPPGVKTKGNVPTATESELKAEANTRTQCIADCVEARKAEAKAADAIDAECQAKCLKEVPIRQVEVVPDGPVAAPPQ